MFLKKIVFFILLYLYIYNIQFRGAHMLLSTTYIYGYLEFIQLIISIIQGKTKLAIQHRFKKFFTILCVLFLLSTLSMSVGGEMWGYILVFKNIIYFLGSLFLIKIYYKYISRDNYTLFIYLIYAILMSNIIAVLSLLFQPLQLLIANMQAVDIESGAISDILKFSVRGMTFGEGNFFSGGVISGIGALVVALLIKMHKLSIYRGTILFIFIVFCGMFVARTSLILSLCSFAFFIPIYRTEFIRINFRWVLIIIYSIVILSIVIHYLNQHIKLTWVFELFIKSGSTSSSNELKSFYDVYPKKLITWLVGDGRMYYADGRYYMNIDPGYLRYLFYGGIPFVSVVLLYYFTLIKEMLRNVFPIGLRRIAIFAFFLLILLGSIKGVVNCYHIFILLCCMTTQKERYELTI